MNTKLATFLLLAVAGARSKIVEDHHRPHNQHQEEHVEDYNDQPHYKFEYNVHDPHTGDIKSHAESREGDHVRGFYSLKEADGATREVHYTADHKHGFNAEVKRIPAGATGSGGLQATHPHRFPEHDEAAPNDHRISIVHPQPQHHAFNVPSRPHYQHQQQSYDESREEESQEQQDSPSHSHAHQDSMNEEPTRHRPRYFPHSVYHRY